MPIFYAHKTSSNTHDSTHKNSAPQNSAVVGTKVPQKSATDSAPNSALKIGANSALVSIGPAREAKGARRGQGRARGGTKWGNGSQGGNGGETGVRMVSVMTLGRTKVMMLKTRWRQGLMKTIPLNKMTILMMLVYDEDEQYEAGYV